MKQLILGLILIFSITVSVAQPQIVFDNKNHDFGTFEEETGPVTHDFQFVNSGLCIICSKPGSSSVILDDSGICFRM